MYHILFCHWCFQVFDDILYTGNIDGKVHLYRLKDGVLENGAVLDVGHKTQVLNIKVSRGSILTASTDELISTLPTKPTRTLFHMPFKAPVNGVRKT